MAVDRLHLLVMRQVPPTESDEREHTVGDAYRSGTPEEAAHFNSLVATQTERHIVHHPDDATLVDALVLGPRTEWGEEILETIREGDTVRVRGRVRRVPKG